MIRIIMGAWQSYLYSMVYLNYVSGIRKNLFMILLEKW